MRKSILVLVSAVLMAFAAASAAAYTPAQAANASWTVAYWNNTSLRGSPAIMLSEDTLNHNWRGKSPVPGTIRTDRFSARWVGSASFEEARYLFRATSDDGIRVWVDNKKIVDQWDEHPQQSATVPYDMTAGSHTIKVEYFEYKGDAIAILNWSTVSDNPWKAQYFKGTALSGRPAVTRYENEIKNYWNATRPVSSVKANNFSARWVRTQDMSAGKYRFKVTVSGGFRLYLDGKLIMDEWYDHGTSASQVNIKVRAGSHRIRLDYYNRAAPAILVLGIKLL